VRYTYNRTRCLRPSPKTDDASFPFPTYTPMEGTPLWRAPGSSFYVVTRTGGPGQSAKKGRAVGGDAPSGHRVASILR
jgi:hypothetical protein